MGAAGTFAEQVDIAVREQHIQQLQVALHVASAHLDHLRGKHRLSGLLPGPAPPRPTQPLLRLPNPNFLGLTLNSCSSFSRNTWIISRRR